MAIFGIDVSEWQSEDASASTSYDFLFARATWGDEANGFVDKMCDTHIQNAIRRGKLFGFYHFMTSHDAVAQADFFVKNCENYFKHGIPVLDFEDMGRNPETAVSVHGDSGARRFLDRVYELTGVRPLVYASSSVARGLTQVAAGNYGLWVASWGDNSATGYMQPHEVLAAPFPFVAVHQYSSNGQLSGYDGRLDLDIAYLDDTAWMKYANPAGDTTSAPAPAPAPAEPTRKSVEELAKEVWAGKWGNGEERYQRLTAAGYDYDAVQDAVNSTHPSNCVFYTVKSGDTLSEIAEQYGTTWQALAELNNLSNPDLIYPNQKIRIS